MFTTSARVLGLAFLSASWLLPVGEAGAVCLGIGAAQSCSDGLDRVFTADESTRRIIKLNKPLIEKAATKPAFEARVIDPSELKAADKALNFTSMYPGFAAGGKASAPFCGTGACR